MTNMIHAQNLSKSYGQKKALNQINIDIPKGRIVGLIGPNGAGKTTFLKAMLGLTQFKGHMRVAGQDPSKSRAKLMQEVSYIADVAVLPRWIKVEQLFEYIEGIHPNFSRQKAQELLGKTNVKMSHKVRELSKGMVAQLHLALVMAIDAQLLVLDEPTLGLDILYRKAFYDALLNDYFEEDKTILVTTHQVEEIEYILTDVIFIKNGEIALQADMETLHARFTSLLCHADQLETALALKPIHQQNVFGKHLLLFDQVARDQLEPLGELTQPGIADLFVALMKEPQV